ncbi:MAG: putative glycosyl transferase [Firmicutes bacterium ADurb.Bin419]|nr:MAG: putative glycosyl transferase [Firmicutes bacterium ADurb.Bin419]
MREIKKTLWIISELFPPDETSTAFILGEIANVMTKKYEVKVICGPEIYDKRKKTDPNNKFVLDPQISVTHVKGVDLDKNTFFGKAMRFAVISRQLYTTAKKNIKEGDKVLLVTNPAPVVAMISRLRKKCNFELNILVHDVFPENTKPAGLKLSSWAYQFLKNLFDKAYSRADQLIALGRDMKQVLEQKVARFEHQPKVTIIENWADLDIVSPMDLPMHPDNFVLEYAGNIGRVQGLQELIENLKESSNNYLEFHLWGTGAEENRLKDYTQSHKMSNVVFHGAYLRSKQSEVINSCDMALVTLTEGMFGLGVPSKTYNIMAAGKAILFIGELESEIGLLVKEKQIGVVFRPDDKSGIVKFLASLSKDKQPEFAEKGKRARQVAETEYAKDIILNKFVEAI